MNQMSISIDQKQDRISEIENDKSDNEEFYSLLAKQTALIRNRMTDEQLEQFDIIHQLIGEKIEALIRLRSNKIYVKSNDEIPGLEEFDDEMPGLYDPTSENPVIKDSDESDDEMPGLNDQEDPSDEILHIEEIEDSDKEMPGITSYNEVH